MNHPLAGQTVLVTGANGFLGGTLSRRLAHEGAVVRAMVRNPQRAAFIQNVPNIDIVTGDVADAERMIELAQDCSHIFHVAATTSGPMKLQHRVNVEGTANMAQAALDAQAQRLVYVSSIAVYGYKYEGTVTEALPPQPSNDAYHVTKTEAEALLNKLSDRLEFSIIRPGMIYGPRSGLWTGTAYRLARLRPMPWIGPGDGAIQAIHVDDVVQQMLILATHPAAIGEAFNSTPDPPVSWREYFRHYAELTGKQRWLALPPLLGDMIAPVAEAVLKMRGDPHDTADALRFVQRWIVYSMDKSRRLLDWEPQIDLKTGIESCVPWLREQGLLK